MPSGLLQTSRLMRPSRFTAATPKSYQVKTQAALVFIQPGPNLTNWDAGASTE